MNIGEYYEVHLFVFANYLCHMTYRKKVLHKPRASNKGTKMQKPSFRLLNHIKPEIWPRFLNSGF